MVVGAGFDQPESDLEDRDSLRDEQIDRIDELYRQLARSRDSEPHPMDEIAAFRFETLRRVTTIFRSPIISYVLRDVP